MIYLLQKFCFVEFKGLLSSSLSLEPKKTLLNEPLLKMIIFFYSIYQQSGGLGRNREIFLFMLSFLVAFSVSRRDYSNTPPSF